jgi:16S rRNA (adenine1518-N6/adenine1519-N6)-dimethyltransferase
VRRTSSRLRKRLGQCFLKDRNILKLEARLAAVEGKQVLEIGAGDGRLTEVLLEHRPKKIIAVEKDAHFARMLKEKFAGGQVEIIEEDFLKIRIPKVEVVVGNIPYYISSDIIFSIGETGFERAVLMVQKEFAQKMVAKPGDRNYGRLSVTAQIHFNIKVERTVLRHLFRPVPKVDSAIVILKPTGASLNQFQENVIRYLFQHRNKTVRNALLDSKMFEKEELRVLGVFAKRRVKTLSKGECLEIAGLLENI